MSSIRKLASQTVLYGFTYLAARLLNFFLTPYYTRIFSREEYGSVIFIYAWITFFNVLYTYGMETGYFYFANKKDKYEEVAGTSFTSMLISSLFFSAVLIFAAPYLTNYLDAGVHSSYIIFAAAILFFDTISVIPFAHLRKEGKSLRFALLKFLNIAFNIGFNFFFLWFCPYVLSHDGFGTIQAFIQAIYVPNFGVGYVFLSNLISSGIMLLFLIPELKKIPLLINMEVWREMFKYSWPILILGFAGMINETLDRILLKWLLVAPPQNMTMKEAMEQIGVYGACYKLSIFMTLAIQSFRYAAEPFFFAQMKDGNNKDIYARMLKYFTFVTSLIFLGVMLYIPILIKIIGRDFRHAEAVVPILLIANLFLGIFVYLSQWYKQTEKTLYGAYLSLGGAGITLLVNFIFIPYYGYMASAWATLICYFSMATASYFIGKKHYPVAYQTGRILLYLGSSIGLYLLSIAVRRSFFTGWNINAYVFNSVLIISFIGLFVFLEKPSLVMKRSR